VISCKNNGGPSATATSNSNGIGNRITGTNTQQPIVLKLNLPDSIKIRYDLITKSDIEKEVNGIKSDNVSNVEMNIIYNIKNDTTNGYKISLHYVGLKAKIKSDDNEKDLDAGADPASDTYDPEDRILAVFKDAEVNAVVTPNGKVKSLSGVDDIAHKMYQLGNNNPQSIEVIKAIVNKYASADFFRTTIEKNFKVFPFKSIKIGDTWEQDDTLQSDLKFPLKTIYKLESVDDGIATISVSSDIKMVNQQYGGSNAYINLEGSEDGEMKIDVGNGLVHSNETTLKIEGDISAGNNDIPIKIKMSSKIEGTVL
jgi:hypothetical protein